MNELAFTRASLWPWFLLLPVLFAALWWAFGRARLVACRYGAASVGRVPQPSARAARLTGLAGLGLLVGVEVVPDQDDMSLDVAEQMSKEDEELFKEFINSL